MTRLFKIYFSFILLTFIGGCKFDSAQINNSSSYSFDISYKSQKKGKTNTSQASYGSLDSINTLEYKNLTAQSGNNSSNNISWDIDKDGTADALTDGLLLIRYNFGLTGETLVASAVSGDSTLSIAEIESEIATLFSISDIDADGNVDALTDSLILLRYLFGLRGDSLINDVISIGGATRTSATDIEAYIEQYMPSSPSNSALVNITGNITFDLIPFISLAMVWISIIPLLLLLVASWLKP